MNEEERIIISRRTRSAMTYRVYEDREGKLHMTIYNEDTIGTCILAVCYDIKPEKLRKHINKLEEYEVWDEVPNYMDEILDKGRLIDFTMVSICGRLYRYVYFSDMGETGEKAYKYLTNNE